MGRVSFNVCTMLGRYTCSTAINVQTSRGTGIVRLNDYILSSDKFMYMFMYDPLNSFGLCVYILLVCIKHSM